ncbi:hypothetical protein BpHYR1_028949 [Brachionus plicatilis]|uniref:Uncharacterized protein n=1 Tax=Brachionus plicatilis TaxID=10195 RepID=A0A3M7PRZ5_BRAPC|nr:hypothetical protein BpHYR1_028949 [Brachionus plicatilis]
MLVLEKEKINLSLNLTLIIFTKNIKWSTCGYVYIFEAKNKFMALQFMSHFIRKVHVPLI